MPSKAVPDSNDPQPEGRRLSKRKECYSDPMPIQSNEPQNIFT